MAEITGPEQETAEFPPEGLPFIFADQVTNLSYSDEVVKFYLTRQEPSVNGVGPGRLSQAALVVLPKAGFVGMALFFAQMLDNLRNDGKVDDSAIEAMRNLLSDQAK